MVLLENSIFNLWMDFNNKLQHLKEWKVKIIENVKTKNEWIKEINKELGVNEELFYPQIDEVLEYPEKIYDLKYEDIVEYVKKVAKTSKEPVEVKKSAFGTKKVDPNAKVEKTKEEIEAELFEQAYLKDLEKNKVEEKPQEVVESIERKGWRINT